LKLKRSANKEARRLALSEEELRKKFAKMREPPAKKKAAAQVETAAKIISVRPSSQKNEILQRLSAADSEKGVLSSMMQMHEGPMAMAKTRGKLTAEHFYSPVHGTIFTALCKMRDEGSVIDLITLTQWLRDEGLLDEVGGEPYISELATFVPTAAAIEYYIDIVREKFVLREIRAAAIELEHRIVEPQASVAEILSFAAQTFAAIGLNGAAADDRSRTLDQFAVDPQTDGGNLLGKRWLCRGGGALMAAPTGVGKTTFEIQGAIMFALGRDHFGIKPSGKLRVLIIQAENDDGDIAEIRDGIFAGLNLSPEERAEACATIEVVCESATTGPDFIVLVRRLVAKHKPDLLIVDPFFAYLGDSVSEQKAVSAFLRTGLNPILQEYGCGAILVHHTNKPKTGKEKVEWRAGDYAYLGAGTAEIANWARAVMAIRSLGSHTVFSVELGKRGRRAGLVNDEGEPVYSFLIKHTAHGGICWEPATDDDLLSATPAKTTDDVYHLLPISGAIPQERFFEIAGAANIGARRARKLIGELIGEARVFEWLTPRPNARAAISYSRQEQELIAR
jgi:hypothetical protein